MKDDLTAIMILMDGSGSMETLRTGVIDGVNKFVASQKEAKGRALFSLAQFDSVGISLRYNTIYDFRDIQEVPKLTRETYVPNGGTPLLDATSKAVKEFGAKLAAIPESHRPGKVILVIVTDGEENSSRDTTRAQVKEMLKHQQEKYNWQVVYLGANQDSFAESAGLGIAAAGTMNYASTYQGITHGLNMLSASTRSYRSGAKATMDFLDVTDTKDEEEKTIDDANFAKLMGNLKK